MAALSMILFKINPWLNKPPPNLERKMKRILLLITIFSFATSVSAQLRLGSLKKISKSGKPANAQKDRNSTSSAKSADGVMLDNVLMRRFLLGTSNGLLQLSQLRAMGLPRSLDQTRNFKVTYRNSAGKSLAAFTAYAQAPNRKRSWLLGNFQAVDDASRNFKFSEAGDYYLEFSAGEQVFDRFSFSIAKHNRANGSVQFIKNGAWNDLGFLEYDDRDRSPQLTFVFYLRDLQEGTGVRKDNTGKYDAKLVRAKDGKILGWNNKDGRGSIYPQRFWSRQQLQFTDAQKPERLSVGTVLGQDGEYFIELNFEGKTYGKYTFSVEGGQFKGLSQYRGEKIGSDGTVFWLPKK